MCGKTNSTVTKMGKKIDLELSVGHYGGELTLETKLQGFKYEVSDKPEYQKKNRDIMKRMLALHLGKLELIDILLQFVENANEA